MVSFAEAFFSLECVNWARRLHVNTTWPREQVELEHSVEELVGRARLHDAEAFAELIRRFEGLALSIAYARTRNPADAGDVVQESFLRAWQRLDSLEDPSRFSHWLGRMVRNLAIDHVRRKRPLALDTSIDIADVSPNSGASAGLEQSEQRGKINTALDTLDELSRTCVVMRYYENMSSKEIAAVLDLTPAAVDMRLSRARTQLRDKLDRTLQDEA
jgi:RNA polymerase sigma-70 factor (ECF subfamily)